MTQMLFAPDDRNRGFREQLSPLVSLHWAYRLSGHHGKVRELFVAGPLLPIR